MASKGCVVLGGNPLYTSGTLGEIELSAKNKSIITYDTDNSDKVPYTGATGNIDLGIHSLNVGEITATKITGDHRGGIIATEFEHNYPGLTGKSSMLTIITHFFGDVAYMFNYDWTATAMIPLVIESSDLHINYTSELLGTSEIFIYGNVNIKGNLIFSGTKDIEGVDEIEVDNLTVSTDLTLPGTSYMDSAALSIGTLTPGTSSIFEIVSTTKGVVLPRMTTVQKNAIVTPVAGMIIYDTDLDKLCVYTGAAFETVTSA